MSQYFGHYVGHYVLMNDLSPSEWPGVLENTKYLGVVLETLDNKYKIRVIGEVEKLHDGVYSAADYGAKLTVQRDIQQVEELPASTYILCD